MQLSSQQTEEDIFNILQKELRSKNYDIVDGTTAMYSKGNTTLNFEYPLTYPEEPPKVECFLNGESSDYHSSHLNEYAKINKSKTWEIVNYFTKNKNKFDIEKKAYEEKKKKTDEKELIENFLKENPKFKNHGRYAILSEIEKSKGNYLDSSQTEYQKRSKFESLSRKTTTKEEKEKRAEKKKVQDIKQEKATMAKFLKQIQITENTELSETKKTNLVAHIKGLSSFLMFLENRKKAIEARIAFDIGTLIKILGDDKITWDYYIEEILIYATFIGANLAQFTETRQDLIESRVNYVFWSLSKRVRGEIRDHINDIMERLDIDLNFSMDIFKSFNQSTFSDFKFKCIDETIIYSHKCILNVLCGGFDLQENEFYVPKEISSFATYEFLKFIYSPSIYAVSKEHLGKLQNEGIDEFENYIKNERILTLFQNIFLGKKIEIEMDNLMEDQIFKLLKDSTEHYPDIEFSCFNSKTEEIEILKAHKVILTSRSDYFEKMFALGLVESTQEIIESEFDVDVTKVILTYLYCQNPDSNKYLNNQNVINCLYASDMYMIRSLKIDCQNVISGMIEKDNFESLIQISDEFNCPILLKNIQLFVKEKKIPYLFTQTFSL